jgi:hypothetical protein
VKLGVYHDLDAIFIKLNHLYFNGSISAQVVWGKKASSSLGLQRSIRLGSYCSKRRLITIHPALDQALVPRLCVERILFHEMLHQQCPPKQNKRGRRSVHPPEFLAQEKKFAGLNVVDEWFKAHLTVVLAKPHKHP